MEVTRLRCWMVSCERLAIIRSQVCLISHLSPQAHVQSGQHSFDELWPRICCLVNEHAKYFSLIEASVQVVESRQKSNAGVTVLLSSESQAQRRI